MGMRRKEEGSKKKLRG